MIPHHQILIFCAATTDALRLTPTAFFGGPKPTNPTQQVTDKARMRLRVKSPDGKASYPLGDLDLELFGEACPTAVGVFKALVQDNKYASTTFHRIIRGFMVQAGEGVTTDEYDDDPMGLTLRFGLGALAMSNAGEPNSSNAQFFISTARADELDGNYVIIGRVAPDSINVLKQVEKCGSTDGDLYNDVVIVASQLLTSS
ncbi:hypothetical protein CTAYLR_000373 [Chrysophaeum taylorii]|uniref:Peptidyl-prolyl cis-trans isomerase n=1 Tax=Chrysophaeum taylorii TaxID=2483200 RepID=A0AAD7UHQ8_9STRA|nr:hypothetical protein CTAYLR_000373 [Chrysophaeum taylorii]